MFVSSRIQLLIVGSVSVWLSACSSNNHPGRALHGFDYLNAKTSAPLVVPAQYPKPQIAQDYEIPPLKAQYPYTHLVGSKVDIQPPEQIIGLVSGELQMNNQQPSYVFERPSASSKAQTQQWMVTILQGYAHHFGGNLVQQKANPLTFSSGMLTEKHHIDNGFFDSKDIVYQSQFNYELNVLKSGRSVTLIPHLVSYQRDPREYDQLSNQIKHRIEVEELNRVIAFVANVQHAQKARAIQRAKSENNLASMRPIDLQMQNNDGVATLIAKAPVPETIHSLEKALPVLGFKVTGFVSEAGKMTVDYDQPSSSTLADYGVKPVQLAEDKYYLTIGGNGDNTQITISDEDGVLTPARLNKIYPALKHLLATMSKPQP
ncbi:outer membrane protein assembly factor BamC [Celerinatantimonas sp. MCCC 1A17872]|uniref:outer membrane protein assembly factor BamC n=1 Tax=Celerinatantimonas sp. MCCC 1A17872 TaxID=3177514 RepID=UPI0038C19B71